MHLKRNLVNILMPKINKYVLYFLITLIPVILNLLYISPLFAQSESITNERVPVKAKQLEAHWNINCEDTIKNVSKFLAANNKNATEKLDLQSAIKKCIYIYNTKNSTHYKAKPDFTELLDKLNKQPD